MDIGVALTYVTKDEGWLKKVLIGGLLFLIPIVGGMIVYGYGVRIARNVIAGEPNPLPEWDDIGGDLSRGLFIFIGALIWAIPLYVIFGCAAILSSVSDSAGIISLFLDFCIGLPLSLAFYAFVVPTIIGAFARTNDFKSMLQFNELFARIRSTGFGPYLMFLILAIVAYFVTLLGLIACFIGVLFTGAYAMFAVFHGAGQLARIPSGTATDVYAPPSHPAF